MQVVIVGAGQAGLQLALSLRQNDPCVAISLIGDELHTPFQRPPLSKGYLKGGTARPSLELRPPAVLAEQRIALHLGAPATRIDRGRKLIAADSVNCPADHMVARRLVASRARKSAERLADTKLTVKSMIEAAAA